MQKLQTMNKSQKEQFLSMDLANRMIRIEQKVAGKIVKKKLKPEETEYYKSLSSADKTNYGAFLQAKKKKSAVFASLVIVPLLLFSIFRPGLTGNVIVENGTITFSSFEVVLLGLFVLMLILFLVLLLDKKLIERRLNRHVKVIEHVLARKYLPPKKGKNSKQ